MVDFLSQLFQILITQQELKLYMFCMLGASAAACWAAAVCGMGPQDPESVLETCPRMPLRRGGQGSTATNSSEHGWVVAQGICPQPLTALRWPSEAEES